MAASIAAKRSERRTSASALAARSSALFVTDPVFAISPVTLLRRCPARDSRPWLAKSVELAARQTNVAKDVLECLSLEFPMVGDADRQCWLHIPPEDHVASLLARDAEANPLQLPDELAAGDRAWSRHF